MSFLAGTPIRVSSAVASTITIVLRGLSVAHDGIVVTVIIIVIIIVLIIVAILIVAFGAVKEGFVQNLRNCKRYLSIPHETHQTQHASLAVYPSFSNMCP